MARIIGEMARTKLVVASVRKTGVPELSAVAIAGSRLYVADDEKGVALLGARGASFGKNGSIEGIEGLTASGDGKALYAVSENSGRLYRMAIGRDGAIGPEVELGKLPRAGSSKKKGWEGAAWLSKAQSVEKRERLVIVNEKKPRCVGLFAPDDLDDHEILDLPDELADELDDLSDVAIEPSTGFLWILSDESSAIGIAELVKDDDGDLALEAREVIALPLKDAQSEGIVFDAKGRLLLASEEGGTLHTLDVRRR